jgi:hypothetical protein
MQVCNSPAREAAPSDKRLNFTYAYVRYMSAHSPGLFENPEASLSTVKLGRLSEGWKEEMQYAS